MSMLVAGLIGTFGRLNEHQKLKEAAYFEGLDEDDDDSRTFTLEDINTAIQSVDKSQQNRAIRNLAGWVENLGLEFDPKAAAMVSSVMDSVDQDEKQFGDIIIRASGASDSKRFEGNLEGVQAFLSTKSGLAALDNLRKNNQLEYQNFVNYVAYNSKQWIPTWISDRSENINDGINTPVLSRYFNSFLNDKLFARDLGVALGLGGDINTYHIEASNSMFKDDSGDSDMYSLSGVTRDDGTQMRIPFKLGQKDKALMQKFSDLVKMPIQSIIDQYPIKDDISIAQNTSPSIQNGYRPLTAAFRLAKTNLPVENLDPQKSKFLTNETQYKIAKFLVKEFGTEKGEFANPKAMLGALLPFMNEGLSQDSAMQFPGQKVQNISAVQYFKQETGIDIKNLNAPDGAYQAALSSEQKLLKIQSLIKENGLAGAGESLVSGFTGVFGGTGFVAQIAGLIGVEEEQDANFFMSLQQSIDRATAQDKKNKENGISTSLGQLQALRVVAAFEMARAFDPSGRLSNMDVEMQMARLGGGGFTSVEKAIAQLDVAINDVRNRKNFYEIVTNINTSGELTPMVEAQIDAAVALNTLQQTYLREQALAEHGVVLGQPTMAGFYMGSGVPFSTGTATGSGQDSGQASQVYVSKATGHEGVSFNIQSGVTIPYSLKDTMNSSPTSGMFVDQDQNLFLNGNNVGKIGEKWDFVDDANSRKKFILIK